MADICIIAVAFDRPSAIVRLLKSLLRADYMGDTVDLLVSIDGGPRSAGTAAAIGPFDWPYGEYRVRRMPENLGLRRHILHCGDETVNYKAVILLEDDIVVGSGFYGFARWAEGQYATDDRVAGISLYSPNFNEMAGLPFAPAPSMYPVYALQSAQSWGQCWTKSMWAKFRAWYDEQTGALQNASDMPDRIYSWPETSWKKYAMKYLSQTGKTWVYPFESHSTNCSEVGTHNRNKNSLYQVRLAAGWKECTTAPLDQLTRYDIYFERENVRLASNIAKNVTAPIMLDLYGTRQEAIGPVSLFTIRKLSHRPIAQVALDFRPHELNASLAAPGSDATLYQINEGEVVNLYEHKRARVSRYHSNLDWRGNLYSGLQGLLCAVRRWLAR